MPREVSHDAGLLAANSAIYQEFLSSDVQREAHDMIESEILSGELHWTSVGERFPREYRHKLDTTSKEHRIWTTFIKRILLQFNVFGFAVYRVVKVGSVGDIESKQESTSV